MTNIENATIAQDEIVAPAAAREFVKKAVEAAKDRANSLQANVGKATTTVEQTLVNTVEEIAKLTRQGQQAAYEDADAFFSGVDKLASAKSLGEAFQIYVDYVRGRNDSAMARARAINDYFGKLLADGSKSLKDNVAGISALSRKAAA
jgi:phasin